MSISTISLEVSETTGAERRRAERFAVRMEVVLRCNGRSQHTIIDDLSRSGVGLSGVLGISANDAVEIELDNGRCLAGTVVWSFIGCCGVQFAQALDEDDPLLPSPDTGTTVS